MKNLIIQFLFGSWGVAIMFQIAFWVKYALKL